MAADDLRSPRPPADEPAEGTAGWHWTPGRIAGIALTVAIAGFWIWAFSPFPDRGNPDRMSDRAFATAAETVCAGARARIDALPPANEVMSSNERASLVDDGTTVVRTMIDDLRALEVAEPDEAEWVSAWLDDYATYAADRDRFAERLRAGDDRAPEFTIRGAEGVHVLVDGFARVNDMDSCVTPGDV